MIRLEENCSERGEESGERKGAAQLVYLYGPEAIVFVREQIADSRRSGQLHAERHWHRTLRDVLDIVASTSS